MSNNDNSRKPIELTLFTMNGCPHCVKMADEWNNLEQMDNDNFDVRSYERGMLHEMDDSVRQINGEYISGFPTIKVSINQNGHQEEYEYQGERKSTDILEFVRDTLKDMVGGAGNNNSLTKSSVQSTISRTTEVAKEQLDRFMTETENLKKKLSEQMKLLSDRTSAKFSNKSSTKPSAEPPARPPVSSANPVSNPLSNNKTESVQTDFSQDGGYYRSSERRSIFSKSESDNGSERKSNSEVKIGGMTELDNLLLREINTLSAFNAF